MAQHESQEISQPYVGAQSNVISFRSSHGSSSSNFRNDHSLINSDFTGGSPQRPRSQRSSNPAGIRFSTDANYNVSSTSGLLIANWRETSHIDTPLNISDRFNLNRRPLAQDPDHFYPSPRPKRKNCKYARLDYCDNNHGDGFASTRALKNHVQRFHSHRL